MNACEKVMPSIQKSTYAVMLVDDSEEDRLLMRRALRSNEKLQVVSEVSDGEEAIAYLSGVGSFSDRQKFPWPDILLLDLKMPRKDGFDVLQWLRSRGIENLIVVVLSGSFLPEDVARSFSYGADAYHKKSAVREEQQAMIREIEGLLRD
jgi:CheY-like chemotaxis protein